MTAVNERLASLAPAAVANARREARDLQAMIGAGGGAHDLAPWDWAYYAEKVRAERYAFDAVQLRPYFALDNVLRNGVFYAAGRLYGLTFRQRTDLPLHHPDVSVFDVLDADGEAARPLPGRLLRAPLEARRRLDELVRLPNRRCSGRGRWWPTT